MAVCKSGKRKRMRKMEMDMENGKIFFFAIARKDKLELPRKKRTPAYTSESYENGKTCGMHSYVYVRIRGTWYVGPVPRGDVHDDSSAP